MPPPLLTATTPPPMHIQTLLCSPEGRPGSPRVARFPLLHNIKHKHQTAAALQHLQDNNQQHPFVKMEDGLANGIALRADSGSLSNGILQLSSGALPCPFLVVAAGSCGLVSCLLHASVMHLICVVEECYFELSHCSYGGHANQQAHVEHTSAWVIPLLTPTHGL